LIQNGTKHTITPEIDLGGFGQFPAQVFVIKVEDGKYAANNATLPDGFTFDGLACFRERTDATAYMELPNQRGISGEVVSLSFEDARSIAKSKPMLTGLLLFVRGTIVEFHFVK
jgi:hypothetical protein